MSIKPYWGMLKSTFSEYMDDNVPRLSAALAYYTMFAIAPLFIIAIAAVSLVFERGAATKQVQTQLSQLMGEQGSKAIAGMIDAGAKHGSGAWATIVSAIILVIAATGVFVELQDAMNTIWEVKPKAQGFWGMLRSRFLSFAMVMGVAFLLLVSLLVSTAVTAMVSYFGIGIIAQIANIVVSLVIVTLLFAMIFRYLPDVKIRWADVWIGAIVTAILFTIGKYLIGLYLAKGSVGSVFGAAGSLVAVLVWVYYSAQILFIGAEFTQVYSRRTGQRIKPDENAVRVSEADRNQQGLTRGHQDKQGDKKEKPWYPAVPVNRNLALTPAHQQSTGSGRLMPLLLGVAVGKLLLGGGKRRRGRGLAPASIVEPGWVSRRRSAPANGLRDEYVLRIKTPPVVKSAAKKINRGYQAVKNRISEYV